MQSPLQGKGRGPNIGTSVPASTRRTPRSRPNSTSPWHLRPTLTSNSGFVSPCGWVVASPPWRRGPQVRAPWRHGGHGVVDVVGPVAPPGRASGRDDSGVYTDWRKWPLGAVLGHLCTLLRRELRRVARAPQPPWRAGSAPSVARLSLGRENRLCASGAARLASSPRQQPTQTPEEPSNMSISRPSGAKVTPCPSARALARPTSSNG